MENKKHWSFGKSIVIDFSLFSKEEFEILESIAEKACDDLELVSQGILLDYIRDNHQCKCRQYAIDGVCQECEC